MSREQIRQRIDYLVTHGGIFPEDRQPLPRAVWVMFAVLAVLDIGHMVQRYL